MSPRSPFERYGSFASAFETGPAGTTGPPWSLHLLNLLSHGAPAVRIVRQCLERSDDVRADVSELLLTGGEWRPQLVGCVALLLADPPDRPLDALVRAIITGSWVSPQLVVTASLSCPSGWHREVAAELVKRNAAKAAAALMAVVDESGPDLRNLAATDDQGGARLAGDWRESLGECFEDAGVEPWW